MYKIKKTYLRVVEKTNRKAERLGDSILRLYTTKAVTHRCPMAVFYDILDKWA